MLPDLLTQLCCCVNWRFVVQRPILLPPDLSVLMLEKADPCRNILIETTFEHNKTETDGPSVRLQILDLGELLHGSADVLETLGRQVGTRDVLDERAEIHARVLFGIAVRSC